MTDRLYDVVVTITRTVRVRVPQVTLQDGEDPQDAAEEFALGGRRVWPDHILSEEEDCDVEDVWEVAS